MEPLQNAFTRVGVFYDGEFFRHVSDYYLNYHERKSRVSISGLQGFIRQKVAEMERVDQHSCRVVDAHYFRGRFSAQQVRDLEERQQRDIFYNERVWDDTLMRAGVVTHYLPLGRGADKGFSEKGIDVWFALEAFELAIYKRFNVSVLVAGDGDYLPLLRKLHTIGTRTMILWWDFTFTKIDYASGKPVLDQMGKPMVGVTRTSQTLLDEATYAVPMHTIIDDRSKRHDPLVSGLFVPRKEGGESRPHADADVGRRNGAVITIAEGYGFIKPDAGGDNVFFHQTALSGVQFADLRRGDRLSFNVGKNEKGPCALDVMRQLVPDASGEHAGEETERQS